MTFNYTSSNTWVLLVNVFIWFSQFLKNRTLYARLSGCLSQNTTVLSGVPQGTVLMRLIFLTIIAHINKGITSSILNSFDDDTKVYSNITQVDI